MPDTPVVQTTVEQVETDISNIFNIGPGAGNVVTTTATPAKPNIFSRDHTDTSFLEPAPVVQQPTTPATPATPEKEKPAATTPTSTPETPVVTLEEILGEASADQTGEGATDPAKAGTTTAPKNTFTTAFTKLIADGLLVPFDDDKPFEDYSAKDVEEWLQANFQERDKNMYQEMSTTFLESLPKELQVATKYVQDGGQDLKGLFQALAHVEQVRELDPEKPEDQEAIYRQYLTAIGFGSAEEVEEELRTWKDLGQLDKKAKQAKPKLDKLQEQLVSRQLEQQEALRQQNEAAAKAYVDHVYKALEPGQLGSLKLDKKTQGFLYNAMVTAQYPSMSGRPTNLLGHLLEKYQYAEPNYPLIAEALWLLSDPDGYRTKLIQTGATQETVKTVRTLKTEEARKLGTQPAEETTTTPTTTRKIPRTGNIFQR